MPRIAELECRACVERKWLDPPLDWHDTGAPSKLSRDDIIVFLGRGTPRRTRSLVSDCRRIPPGHRCNGSNGGFSLERMWSAVQAHSNSDASAETHASELRDLLARRVRELG